MFVRFFLILGVLLPILLTARKVLTGPPSQYEAGPWLTGPLLAPSGHTMTYGHRNYEPYVFYTINKGNYDKNWKSHSIPHLMNLIMIPTFQFGVLPWMEVDFGTPFSYNNCRGHHDWHFDDFPFVIAFQLLMDQKDRWYPAIKLRLSANIPLGKYDHLNPKKNGTDIGGLGNWMPNIGLVFSRLFHFCGDHYLAWRFFLNYIIPIPTHVKGLSVFGGAPSIKHIKGTRGTVYLGNIFQVDQGLEYCLTKNWVLALDITYQHANRTRFSGHSPKGTKPIHGSSEQFTFAPAIEYNFNARIGVIAGPWFTIAGRNTSDFISWVFAVNIFQ